MLDVYRIVLNDDRLINAALWLVSHMTYASTRSTASIIVVTSLATSSSTAVISAGADIAGVRCRDY